MAIVRMYCTENCPYCQRAEQLLLRRGAALEKIRVDLAPERFAEMVEMTGRDTLPQIFIGERYVGGYDDLVDLDMDGDLQRWLVGS